MDRTISIEEEIDFILDKIDNDDPVTRKERILYLQEVHGIKDEIALNFALNGCKIDEDHKPRDPNVGYEI